MVNWTTARILNNLASAFYLLGGAYRDLLLIRIFLTFAYSFLIAFHFYINNKTNWEQYLWSFCCLYLHGSGAVRLLWDERPSPNVKLSEEHELLWRYFYRYSGVTRLLFQNHIAPIFELKTFQKGEELDPDNVFYIVLSGSVALDVEIHNEYYAFRCKKQSFVLGSGDKMHIKHLHSVISSPLLSIQRQKLAAVTMERTRLFCCSAENMKKFTCNRAVKDATQGLLAAVLSDIAIKYFFLIEGKEYDEEISMQNEQSSLTQGKLSPMFDPLEDFEKPVPYLAGGAQSVIDNVHHILHILRRTFQLPWPLMSWFTGIRQIGSLHIPSKK
jgi:hypothetical protein